MDKFKLEFTEDELVLVMAGMTSLAVGIRSKRLLSSAERDKLARLVERVNDEIVAPTGERMGADEYDQFAAETTNRLIEAFADNLLSRRDALKH